MNKDDFIVSNKLNLTDMTVAQAAQAAAEEAKKKDEELRRMFPYDYLTKREKLISKVLMGVVSQERKSGKFIHIYDNGKLEEVSSVHYAELNPESNILVIRLIRLALDTGLSNYQAQVAFWEKCSREEQEFFVKRMENTKEKKFNIGPKERFILFGNINS